MNSSVTSLLVVIVGWLVLAFVCCAGSSSSRLHEVTYRVDGAGGASVVYSNATGGTEMKDIRLPWSNTMQVHDGEFLYLSAQDKSGGGFIDVSILVDKQVIKNASSSGQYVIASASARCCPE